MVDSSDWSSDSELVGGRYQLLNRLGEGAMGTTHRALDRLSGRVVTLKRLKPGGAAVVGEPLTRSDYRLALAQEFRLLASLRHPNIVSVLDYGFDADRRPFFCMDLQENAQTIVDAGRQRPLLVRADLLVQLLRALVYLHRHGIIHCDIKPANVVVVDTQVKVLDFGLSVYGDRLEPEAAPLAGTPLYMAPELLRGARPSQASDLYAAGVLAYELFAGHLLPPGPEVEQVIRSGEGVGRLLRRPDGALDPRVQSIVARLLAGDPAERYADASQVIQALAAALGQAFGSETVATRESLLQNAPLVGRDGELGVLAGRLRATAAGRGGTVLLGGKSGVGKSRLIEELRTRGLVGGFAVVGGQAVSEGGSPYHAWRDVVRGLVVRGTIATQAAGVLRAIVPDLPRLLGRPVADPPTVDPAAGQSRLLLAVEELVRAQTQPVLILLDDLQWAGSESVALLAALARVASALPLLIVGSFRSDEAADFPEQVAGAEVILLPRLDARAIAELARAMMGPAGAQPQVAAFLESETEGIPLFIVEAVRLLAESVGSLAEIGAQPLPPHLLSGGMRQVLQRRVERVPADGVPALRTAAVIGREIDPALLRLVHPRLDSDHWLRTCAAAAVVELHEQGGARFAHDKLREHVLGALAPDQRAALHRQVALAIESAYPNAPERAPALAHHWRLAGDAARELAYAERSAAQALAGGAYREAIARFERALELIEDRGDATGERAAASLARLANPLTRATTREADRRRGLIEAGIGEAYYRLGDLRACERHALLALTTLRPRRAERPHRVDRRGRPRAGDPRGATGDRPADRRRRRPGRGRGDRAVADAAARGLLLLAAGAADRLGPAALPQPHRARRSLDRPVARLRLPGGGVRRRVAAAAGGALVAPRRGDRRGHRDARRGGVRPQPLHRPRARALLVERSGGSHPARRLDRQRHRRHAAVRGGAHPGRHSRPLPRPAGARARAAAERLRAQPPQRQPAGRLLEPARPGRPVGAPRSRQRGGTAVRGSDRPRRRTGDAH